MSTDFNETPGTSRYRKSGTSLGDLWRTKPVFKLIVVLLVLGGAGLGANAYFSRNKAVEDSRLPAPAAPVATDVNATEVTPQYIKAVRQQDEERANEARGTGESAIPTPMQNPVMNPSLDSVTDEMTTDPLREFEESIQQRVNPNPQPTPTPQVVAPVIPPEAMQALQRQMQAQMDQISGQWAPPNMTALVVQQSAEEQAPPSNNAGTPAGNAPSQGDSSAKRAGKIYVPLGAVHYGQMLMEANSDVPGPVMGQILTGPLAGARVIGAFETFRNHLLIRFNKISFRRKEITTDILVLDPGTTLGGIATEVDPRYMTRVILPAASEFLRGIGEALSEDNSTVQIIGTGDTQTVVTSTDKKNVEDAALNGLEAAMDRVGQFVDDEANATKRLVRVAVGTPIGLFFVKAVTECDFVEGCKVDVQ